MHIGGYTHFGIILVAKVLSCARATAGYSIEAEEFLNRVNDLLRRREHHDLGDTWGDCIRIEFALSQVDPFHFASKDR